MPPRPSRVEERQRRYRQGHRGEWLAAAYLKAKGYRILGRRVATGAGEIDIIALRRGRVAFVEVKRRSDLAAAEASVSSRQRQRIHRAADLWLAHHASYQTCQMGFDLIFVLPWRLPKHLPDAL
ncbi:MAG: YraN family protein [Hyphomicrobiaceae bacterium]|nr:YraN family protein [Hyphomicrobiaceae bacterium]MCC0009276.1 YraN family protein [Hyphomicrobiaceae bacterium]